MLLLKLGAPIRRKGVNAFRWNAINTSKFYSKSNNNRDGHNDSSASDKGELSRNTNTERLIELKGMKQVSSSSSPAPFELHQDLEKYMKKDRKVYIPKLKHERLTFEYPGLPNEDNITKEAIEGKPKVINRWSRYVPKIVTLLIGVWGAYTIKVWFYTPQDGSDSKELLDANRFQKFIITHKEDIDDDHFLIEVKPKFDFWQYSYYANYDANSIWNGDRVWSVEIKQPEIMVLRFYTPLPLFFMKSEYTRSGEKKPLLRVINPENNDYDNGGVMCFYIKKYQNGEVSRYIYGKNAGDELELRGPHVDFKFPYHPLKKFHTRPVFKDLPSKVEPEPLVEGIKNRRKISDFDNLTFFAGGTGIAPILQVLLSRNPYRGFVTVHYSAQSDGEIQPFERFIYFLEKLDRLKFIKHIDSNPSSKLVARDLGTPESANFLSYMKLENSLKSEKLHYVSSPQNSEEKKTMSENTKGGQDKNKRGPFYKNALEQARDTSSLTKKGSSLALICGPEGYVSFVAGQKASIDDQGPIGGLLGENGWDNTNTYKL